MEKNICSNILYNYTLVILRYFYADKLKLIQKLKLFCVQDKLVKKINL